MKTEIEKFGFYITSDPSFMNEQNAITPELEEQMDKLYDIALKGKESGIKKLHRLIEKNPRNPQLKNFLSVWYMKRGNSEKSKAVNQWIIAEHPNYLFGKLNLAFEHYKNNEIEKMPEILGEGFHLKVLYPERDTFHIVEVMAMLKAAVFYYSTIGDIEQAEIRLDMMGELEPDSLDFEQASEQLLMEKMKINMGYLMESDEERISVDVARPKITDVTEPPSFNHHEMGILYNYDLKISDDDIEAILALPRETLIKDLELILFDSIERYAYFERITDEHYNNEEMCFVIHSLYFLAELNATESLPKILEALSQGEEYTSLYLDDFLTESVWEVLFKLGKNDLETLTEFMFRPSVYTYVKSEVSKAAEQIALHYPERKTEVLQWFDTVFNYYLNCKIQDNIIDSELIGLLVGNVIDFNGHELLPIIKKLYDKGYVFHGICGSYEDVEKELSNTDTIRRKDEILNLKDRYKQITSTWPDYNEDYDEPIEMPPSYYQNEMDTYLEHNNDNPINDKKISRNDPCPCGSGKKYKKCCL